MPSESFNDCSVQTRGSSQIKMVNVDVNRFYLVENINTKQRHVISHLLVKKDTNSSSSTVQCKATPRGCRFEAKIIFKGTCFFWSVIESSFDYSIIHRPSRSMRKETSRVATSYNSQQKSSIIGCGRNRNQSTV